MHVLHVQTPVLESAPLRAARGQQLLLKMECYQPAASFKIRGIGAACLDAKAAGKSVLVASSGGNAGFAVAYAGAMLGMQTTVFVPESTADTVVRRIAELGATTLRFGKSLSETHEKARAFATENAGEFIHPFDDPRIVAGHTSIIDELVQQIDKPDAIVLSVGGGGLLSGVIEGLRKHAWQDVTVIAAETRGAASLAAALKAKKRVEIAHMRSIAKTLGPRQVSETAFSLAMQHDVRSLVVSDKEALRSCVAFADDHRVLVEAACGAALCSAYDKRSALTTFKRVLIIVCGGISVDVESLCRWRQRYGAGNAQKG